LKKTVRIGDESLAGALKVMPKCHLSLNSRAVIAEQCQLAFVLIKQNKPGEFDEHYQICRQGAGKVEAEIMRKLLDPIEKVLAAQRSEISE